GGGSLVAPTSPLVPLGDLARGARRGRAGLAAEAYLAPFLALAAAVAYRFDAYGPDERRDLVAWSAGAALRLGDVRLAAGADGASVFGAGAASFVRGFVEVRAVLVEHIDLAAAASFRAGSGDATLHVDYYPTRHLGLVAGVFGGR